MTKRLASVIALLVIFACTTPVPEETTDRFDILANAAASMVGAPAELQLAAYGDARTNTRLCSYLSGTSYDLGVPTNDIRPTTLAAEQAAASRALVQYIDALVDATRGESLQTLASAQAELAVSTEGLLTELEASDQAGGLFEAAFPLVARIGEANRQTRIRAIMREAIDPLFVLEFLLTRDLEEVVAESRRAVSSWDDAATCVLRQRRNQGDAVALFEQFDERRLLLRGHLAAAERAPGAVRALRIAHIETVTADVEFETALAEIVAILEDVDALRRAVEG